MTNKEVFNDEMEDYLEKKHDDVEEETVEQPVEQETEVQEEKAEEVVKEKPGFFKKLMTKINIFDSEEEEEGTVEEMAPQEAEVVNDMKDLGRIVVTILKSLPPEQLKEFKQTDEFKKFKDILKKYSVIK